MERSSVCRAKKGVYLPMEKIAVQVSTQRVARFTRCPNSYKKPPTLCSQIAICAQIKSGLHHRVPLPLSRHRFQAIPSVALILGAVFTVVYCTVGGGRCCGPGTRNEKLAAR